MTMTRGEYPGYSEYEQKLVDLIDTARIEHPTTEARALCNIEEFVSSSEHSPSKLFFTCADKETAERVKDFFSGLGLGEGVTMAVSAPVIAYDHDKIIAIHDTGKIDEAYYKPVTQALKDLGFNPTRDEVKQYIIDSANRFFTGEWLENTGKPLSLQLFNMEALGGTDLYAPGAGQTFIKNHITVSMPRIPEEKLDELLAPQRKQEAARKKVGQDRRNMSEFTDLLDRHQQATTKLTARYRELAELYKDDPEQLAALKATIDRYDAAPPQLKEGGAGFAGRIKEVIRINPRTGSSVT